MALIEFILLLGTILLFILSDSRTIDIVAKDILPHYGIGYQKISGNLFTGIKITSLEYNNSRLVDKINIHFDLAESKTGQGRVTKQTAAGLSLNTD
jgi:hypothetical protein